MMYWGIEYNTDLRCPQTKVTRLGASRSKALEWGSVNQGFAFPGSAIGSLPVSRQNWHRRLGEVYETSSFRMPSPSHLAEMAYACSTRAYPRTIEDAKARCVRQAGERVRMLATADANE